jgi:hypothetical protein
MEIPKDVKVHQMRSSYMWIDKDGIVFSTPVENPPESSTNEEILEDMKKFRELTGNKKVCIIIESAPSSKNPPREQRDLIERELNSVVLALAVISTSPLSKMLANIFFSLKPPKYPVKMFTSVTEATEWIKSVCDIPVK